MKAKTIFRTLAAAMLMPAMLLTASCSSEDNLVNNENTGTAAKQGYTLPVTVNVTRQGDNAATRATYDDGTKTLAFSTGDKLHVKGYNNTAYDFAGTLTWQSGGTFSGEITTYNDYTGTADELFSEAIEIYATLLPNGYTTYNYLEFRNTGYKAEVTSNRDNAFATSKAAAVEQLSYEEADEYDDGFALTPQNAILNFTITGLAASTDVAVEFKSGTTTNISKTVTTDASGTATFAIGAVNNTRLHTCTLTVGGNDITLVSESKTLSAGKIYNISRSVAPAARTLAEATAEDIGKIAGADGKIYATKDDAEAVATGNAVAMIAYVGNESDCSHGLAIALADESSTMNWTNAGTACSNKTPAVTGGTWRLPSIRDWQNMFIGCGASGTVSDSPSSMSYSELASKLSTAGGDALQSNYYWSSTGFGGGGAYGVVLGGGGADFNLDDMDNDNLVRACLAF